jgi:hypothetical protein
MAKLGLGLELFLFADKTCELRSSIPNRDIVVAHGSWLAEGGQLYFDDDSTMPFVQSGDTLTLYATANGVGVWDTYVRK